MYAKDYVFPLALTAAWRADLQRRTQTRLSEMLGVEVDTVMAEYVLVMVGNKKSMAQIAHDLIDFIGDESAEQFVQWLSGVLPTYEAQGAGDADADAPTTSSAATTTTIAPEAAAPAPEVAAAAPPAKRIISLKSSASSTDAAPKLVSLSASRGSIRSLGRAQAPSDDVLAKRSQRFGAVEKSPPPKKLAREDAKAPPASATAAKRKASAEPESAATPAHSQARRGSGGRLSQLLGPPVNVDQAELDARDSLNTNKKKKPNPRAAEPERERRSRSNGRSDRNDRNNQENRDADSTNRKPARRAEQIERPLRQGDAPPLPPSDRPERTDKCLRFQNRTWVNPNVAKADDATAESAGGEATTAAGGGQEGSSSSSAVGGLNPGAPPFAPRNPFFSSQMRPRFQNKTWVRQDPAKDEELSLTLPTTPPPDGADADTAE
ncbi:hypothetical protein PybrP1_006739 [[Pythium] brassicae (nom. inval.)]|nr:hypothetical protein PybrP1_006739 [[Pythium] brassicae (nom. inval.)]